VRPAVSDDEVVRRAGGDEGVEPSRKMHAEQRPTRRCAWSRDQQERSSREVEDSRRSHVFLSRDGSRDRGSLRFDCHLI
jgi:hypothetical protein